MLRHTITPRTDWEKKVQEQGFLFYKHESYYSETAAYEFTATEVDQIEAATSEIFDMCMAVAGHVIKNDLWDKFFIPREYADLIKWSWNEDMPSFYGRMDLVYNNGDIKLLEFNADTPTSLLEASVIQWYWLQDYDSKLDQFNSIHEKLEAHMKVCAPYFYAPNTLTFACAGDSIEDLMTTKYLQDVANQAGIRTDFVYMNEIGVDDKGEFYKTDGTALGNIFKLYPYEWMFHEEFGKYLSGSRLSTLWIEPAYKAIWSNKMLLVCLHELFPNSKYILPATYRDKEVVYQPGKYVQKPVLSREGANVKIVKNGVVAEQTGGEYGEEGFVIQDYAELPDFDGNHPVIGSWLIGGVPAGMGIRESGGLITNNTSRFVPHFFK
jgi:glutathionylspermidine synthase